MKQILCVLIVLSCVKCGFNQYEFSHFYPSNALYKLLKVKSKTDTVSASGKHFKEEYDTLGRQTADYYVEGGEKTIYNYLKKGDTLLCNSFKVNGYDTDIYHVETFIYNAKGKIVIYESCYDNNNDKNKVCICGIDSFLYSPKGNLTEQRYYMNSQYPQLFSKDLKINPQYLTRSNFYIYKFNKMNKLSIIKQILGKPEDKLTTRLFYDSQNRLIRKTTFIKECYENESKVYNHIQTNLIEYKTNKRIERSVITYDDPSLPPSGRKSTNKQFSEYIFYPNGLEKTHYNKVEYITDPLFTYYIYEFY